MADSVFGQVVAVRRSAGGDIEIDFYHEGGTSTYRHSPEPGRPNFPKNLIEPLCLTLATDICSEIFFDDAGNPVRIEMEQCDEESDEDSVFGES